jgi:hypothetical protein
LSNFSKIDAHLPKSFRYARINFNLIPPLSAFKLLSTVYIFPKLFTLSYFSYNKLQSLVSGVFLSLCLRFSCFVLYSVLKMLDKPEQKYISEVVTVFLLFIRFSDSCLEDKDG